MGELTVDPSTRAVPLAGKKVELAAKEFALLHALAEEPTRVYGKRCEHFAMSAGAPVLHAEGGGVMTY